MRVIPMSLVWNKRSSMYGCEGGNVFAIRAFMKNQPMKLISVCLVSSVFFFAYATRIAEAPIAVKEQKLFETDPTFTFSDFSHDFSFFENCLWTMIVTMTTVGFGDYFPQTNIGRLIVFICCLWGMAIVSLMVVTVTNSLELSPLESQALTVLLRLKQRESIRNEAAYILTLMGKMRKRTHTRQMKNDLKRHIRNFRQSINHHKELQIENVSEDMANQFKFLTDEFRDMQEKQIYLAEAAMIIGEHMGVGDLIKEDYSDLVGKKKSPSISAYTSRMAN